jgi:hypothetical protein
MTTVLQGLSTRALPTPQLFGQGPEATAQRGAFACQSCPVFRKSYLLYGQSFPANRDRSLGLPNTEISKYRWVLGMAIALQQTDGGFPI